MARISNIVKTYLPILDEKVGDLAGLYGASPEEPAVQSVLETDHHHGTQHVEKDIEPDRMVSTANGDAEHKVLIAVLAKQLDAARPLIELVVSDVYTSDERVELRAFTDVFSLSNALNRLCGETARNLKPVHWHKASSHGKEQ